MKKINILKQNLHKMAKKIGKFVYKIDNFNKII